MGRLERGRRAQAQRSVVVLLLLSRPLLELRVERREREPLELNTPDSAAVPVDAELWAIG